MNIEKEIEKKVLKDIKKGQTMIMLKYIYKLDARSIEKIAEKHNIKIKKPSVYGEFYNQANLRASGCRYLTQIVQN